MSGTLLGLVFGLVLIALGVALLVPAVILLLETGAALLPPRAPQDARRPWSPKGTVAVLVPAHDEESQIAGTVRSLMLALAAPAAPEPGSPPPRADRLIVIADNCTDGTATAARAAGAETRRQDAQGQVEIDVIVRDDPARRGKGFAIAFGLRHLDADPPEVVVLVDADCRLATGELSTLTRLALSTGRPVQAEYVLQAPPNPSPLAAISALAVLLRNRVRPRGLGRLGFPCHLTGSGMAFPWRVLREAPETEANLVEDLVMGLDMALGGAAPLLCPSVQVTSELPAGRAAAATQRRRWEHGQLHTLATYVPRLLAAGLHRRQPALIALGLDLLVPPLALLVMLQAALAALAWASWGLHAIPTGRLGATAVALGTAGLVGTGCAVVAAWARFGRATVPLRFLIFVPFYVAWKLPLYLVLALRGRQRTWVRTAREGAKPSSK